MGANSENPVDMQRAECRRLGDELEAIYKEAGIFAQVEEARLGPLIPHGVFDDQAPIGSKQAAEDNEDYFDDQFDYTRRKIRDLVFRLEDASTRKRIIVAHARVTSAARIWGELVTQRLHREMREAQRGVNNLPWGTAAVTGAACVALGYWVFNMPGALAGAVFGFFIGQGTITNARAQRLAELEQAKQAVEEDRKDNQEEDSLRPPYFSSREEESGERDSEMDRLSATVNRARARG